MKLRKEFGQHFLIDESKSQAIVESLIELGTKDLPLLEIGPGAGAITKYLKNISFPQYKVVEIDEEKVAYLIQELKLNPEQIILGDFLEIQKPFQEKFQIIGNFPYNISSQIMFKVLEWKDAVQAIVGMFQKEVAQRIASKEGNKNYGILSVILQAYFDIEYLFDVPPQAFNPPPKVMSGVIALKNNHNHYQIAYPDKFLKLVKAAFAMRRKTLRNNWKTVLQNMDWTLPIFDKRAEQLSVSEFVDFYKSIYES